MGPCTTSERNHPQNPTNQPNKINQPPNIQPPSSKLQHTDLLRPAPSNHLNHQDQPIPTSNLPLLQNQHSHNNLPQHQRGQMLQNGTNSQPQINGSSGSLPKVPSLVSNQGLPAATSKLLNNHTDQNRINNPSWMQSPALSDIKPKQDNSHQKESHVSQLNSQAIANEQIPADLAPRSFQHSPDEKIDIRMEGSAVRKVYKERVTPIIEQSAFFEADDENQNRMRKISGREGDDDVGVGLQPLSNVSGFRWEDKVGKVSIIY